MRSGALPLLHDIELITLEEAVDLLRVNVEPVRRLLRTGQLPGRKVGPRQWRTRRVDLEAHLHPAERGDGPPGDYE